MFIVLSIINVTFSTARSIMTIKGGKIIASLFSGGYFAFYNVMLIYTVADFPMWQKCLITFICNVIGVYVVKWVEEKLEKDKLWRIEVTIPNNQAGAVIAEAKNQDLSFNYIDINKYFLFNFYCPTQADSAEVKKLLNQYDAKYFVSESKNL
jgi:effector-binding domain-containing protein